MGGIKINGNGLELIGQWNWKDRKGVGRTGMELVGQEWNWQDRTGIGRGQEWNWQDRTGIGRGQE